MWKKWLAFAGILALTVLLDPTPTPAQPGGKFGREFGKGGPPGGTYGQPPGGGYAAPGGTGASAYPAPGAPGGYGYGRPPRDGNGFGASAAPPGATVGDRPTGGYGAPVGDRPAFGGGPGGPGSGGFNRGPGGPPGGGPGGGGPGGPGGGDTVERTWSFLQRLTNSTGDTVDLSKVPPESQGMLQAIAARRGIELPQGGVLTKTALADMIAKGEAARAAGGGPGGAPGGFDRGRGMGDPNGYGQGGYGQDRWGQGGYGQGGYGQGDWGQGGWGNRPPFEKKETEEERPVAMRYGKLPQGLPGWYDDLDTDKDGQVSLYEWRKSGKDTKEFLEMDLNGDGLVTADEYLRFARQKGLTDKVQAYVDSDGADRPANWGIGAPIDKGGGPGGKWGGPGGKGGGDKGSDRSKDGDSKGGDSKGGDRKREGNPWFKSKN
jgi:hypothetical protein